MPYGHSFPQSPVPLETPTHMAVYANSPDDRRSRAECIQGKAVMATSPSSLVSGILHAAPTFKRSLTQVHALRFAVDSV